LVSQEIMGSHPAPLPVILSKAKDLLFATPCKNLQFSLLSHSRESGNPGTAKAGIQGVNQNSGWIPACAGMTSGKCRYRAVAP
jgi:hypothetical protein